MINVPAIYSVLLPRGVGTYITDASIIPRPLLMFQMFTINYSYVQAVVGELDVAVDSCSNDESSTKN